MNRRGTAQAKTRNARKTENADTENSNRREVIVHLGTLSRACCRILRLPSNKSALLSRLSQAKSQRTRMPHGRSCIDTSTFSVAKHQHGTENNVPEHGVRLALRRIIDIRVVEQFLDTQQDLPPQVSAAEIEKKATRHTCLIVIPGFQPFSSSRIDKQTVPDG